MCVREREREQTDLSVFTQIDRENNTQSRRTNEGHTHTHMFLAMMIDMWSGRGFTRSEVRQLSSLHLCVHISVRSVF